MLKLHLIPAVVVLSLGTSSCLFRKPPPARVFVPPPPRSKPPIVTTVPELPAPPYIEANVTDEELPPAMAFELPTIPPPPVRRPTPAPPKPAPAVAGPEPAPAPSPRLGPIFTADQYREYNRTVDESLDRVKRALASVAGKNLNPQQRQTVELLRTFQKQVEQMREQDLVSAVNLAQHADVLARDLLQRLP